MRRLILVIFTLSVLCLFHACKKSDDSNPGNSDSIIGTWELRISYGGQGGQTTYRPGNGTIYNFQAGAYRLFSKGWPIKKGTYKIVRDSSLSGLTDRIVYDNEYNAIRIFEKVSNNRLLLVIDGFDAPSAEYARISR